jgi:hemolysin III
MNWKTKPPETGRRKQTLGEEIANAITHGVGVAIAIAALVILVVFAVRRGDPWRVVSFSIYGSSMILLYLASTLYHAFQNPKVKVFFKLMDHSSIYLLIAGTYTPIVLTVMRGPWGWTLFGVIWGLALAGVVFKLMYLGRYKGISVTIYLLMGWMIVFAFNPMITMLPPGLIKWLAIGGACYTLGVVFYVWRGFPYHHSVWHLFVLGGSISHFFGLLFYLAL